MPVDANTALQTSLANAEAKWGSRTENNRLEPECWPVVRPRFEISPGSKIFTVGSCFARNIESYLSRAGFQLPTLEGAPEVESACLNKYTPPSIFQEFDWTFGILNRDDKVRESDVCTLFYERPDGKVVDLHLLPFDAVPYEIAFNRREVVYQIYKKGFYCDSVVMTLGLIEAWKDLKSGLYVLQMPQFLRTKQALAQFEFHKLDFLAAYKMIQKTIDLIDSVGPKKKYLITTSPVPLGRTFTDSDVIIANTYSKSVLRAVAGQIVEENEFVDYFPSFESVILSKERSIWESDLIHVSTSFVDRIMARVIKAYVPSINMETEQTQREEQVKRFQQAVFAKDCNAANEIYGEIAMAPGSSHDAGFEIAAAILNGYFGRLDLAELHAGCARRLNPEPMLLIKLVQIYRKLNDHARVEEVLEDFTENVRSFSHWVGVAADQLEEFGCVDDAIRLSTIAHQKSIANVFALKGLARRLLSQGRTDEAIDAFRSAVLVDGADAQAHFQLGRALLEAGKPEEAATSIKTSLELEPQARTRRFFFATALEQCRRFGEAEEQLRDLAAEDPTDHASTTMLARFLERRRCESPTRRLSNELEPGLS